MIKYSFLLIVFLMSGNRSQFENRHYMVYSSEQDFSTFSSTSLIYENPDCTLDIKLKHDMVYGTNENIIISNIADVSVDNQNRVYIKDNDLVTVHIFEADTDYITSIGREGRGPGEFSSASTNTPIYVDEDLLYVLDGSSDVAYRAQVFRLDDLSFQYTINLYADNLEEYEILKGYRPQQIYFVNGDTLLVAYYQSLKVLKNNENFIYYMLQDRKGKILTDPVYKQKGVRYLSYYNKNAPTPYLALHAFPFFTHPLFTVSKNGKFYTSKSNSFEIEIYDQSGNLIRTILKPFDNVPLELNSLMDHYNEINYMSALGEGIAEKMLREAHNLPNVWPALKNMFFDDKDHLWISTIVRDRNIYEWWIMEKSGKVISKFDWPKTKPIVAVKNGFLYTKERENEYSDYFIHRYKIILGEMD